MTPEQHPQQPATADVPAPIDDEGLAAASAIARAWTLNHHQQTEERPE